MQLMGEIARETGGREGEADAPASCGVLAVLFELLSVTPSLVTHMRGVRVAMLHL